MSLYQPKGSAYWHYDFQYKGVRHYGSTGVEEKATAKEIEAAVRRQAARDHHYGEPKRKPKLALRAALGRYWNEIGQHSAAPYDELWRADMLVGELGPDTTLDQITDNEMTRVVARLRGRKARYKDTLLAPATVNRTVELLRRVWRRARDLWGADVGESEPRWGAHRLHEPDERVRSLSGDEEQRLFTALREDYHPMVRFALLSGMRLDNVLSLRWSQVDYQTMAITIKTKSRKPGGAVRRVPITQAMLLLLAQQRGHHDTFVFTYTCAKSRGERKRGQRYPFSPDGWRKAWSAALAAAGIQDFRFHDLRHTAATRTLAASGNLKAVSRMLGHTEVTTTAKYAHVLDDDVREAMELGQRPPTAKSRNSPEAPLATAADDGEKTEKNQDVA